jgi:hypothetical protein
MSNTPTTDPDEQPEGTSVTSPNNPSESQPGAVQGDEGGPSEQAGGGQAGG